MRVPWSCGRWWICLSDTVMYNVVIKLFFEAGRVDEVEKLVEEMESVAYSQLDKICKSRSLERALKLSDTTENEDGHCYCKPNLAVGHAEEAENDV
ncbi:hypothetical protein QQ045_006574 [Rhodiola kirilowii]